MQLILKNAGLAANYGTPLADCAEEEVIQDLVAKGWPERQARRHVACAIAAGAYAYAKAADAPRVATTNKRREEDQS